eukprot:296834_1
MYPKTISFPAVFYVVTILLLVELGIFQCANAAATNDNENGFCNGLNIPQSLVKTFNFNDYFHPYANCGTGPAGTKRPAGSRCEIVCSQNASILVDDWSLGSVGELTCTQPDKDSAYDWYFNGTNFKLDFSTLSCVEHSVSPGSPRSKTLHESWISLYGGDHHYWTIYWITYAVLIYVSCACGLLCCFYDNSRKKNRNVKGTIVADQTVARPVEGP